MSLGRVALVLELGEAQRQQDHQILHRHKPFCLVWNDYVRLSYKIKDGFRTYLVEKDLWELENMGDLFNRIWSFMHNY